MKRSQTTMLFVGLCLALLASGCARRAAHAPVGTAAPPAESGIFRDRWADTGIAFEVKSPRRPFTIRESMGHGGALLDYDGDGKLDILLLGPDQARLYQNEGDWRFRDVTEIAGLRQNGYWQAAAVGDYDNDGFPDLYVCGSGSSALYHNDSGKTFREVTDAAGMASLRPNADGQPDFRLSAAFSDADNDGKLDLYVCRYVAFGPRDTAYCGQQAEKIACTPEIYEPQKGVFYHNLGDGKFRDETAARGLDKASGKSIGIAVADMDGDGDTDIALANDEMPGNLFVNDGKGHFAERGTLSGIAFDTGGRHHAGMGIDWGDYDNDGRFDLYVTTFRGEVKNLYRQLAPGLFEDAATRLNLAGSEIVPLTSWGAKFLDYDNDGYADILLTSGDIADNVKALGPAYNFAQPLLLYRNEKGGAFAPVLASQAGAPFAAPMAGRGLCLGDIDNDGRLDALITTADGPPRLLQNVTPNAGNWLGLRLEGVRANRMGLGATVTVETAQGQQIRAVTTSGSCLVAGDARVHFGLGSETAARRVTIRWPGGKTDSFTSVPAGKYLLAREGAASLTPDIR